MSGPRFIDGLDGGTIALHHLAGEEVGKPLVLCHATGFCAGAYRELARHLSGPFLVLGLDFRGHGDSSRPDDGDFSWAKMADELLLVLDELEGPTALVGHSMGAAVALLAARRRPEEVSFVYGYEPIVESGSLVREGQELIEASARRRRRFSSRAEALERYSSRPPLAFLQAAVLSDYVTHGFFETEAGEIELKCRPSDEAATYAAPGKPSPEVLGDLAVPLRLGTGDGGREIARELMAGDGELEVFQGLGHFGPLEAPGIVARAVLDFARDLSRGAPGGPDR